jgi:hypothetical protein
MHQILTHLKDIEIVEPVVTIRSSLKESDLPALHQLSEAMLK